MSLSWRDQLTAFVAPGAVSVRLQARGWWPSRAGATKVQAAAVRHEPRLAPAVGRNEADDPTDLALQLADALRESAGRAFDVSVVLSNHFVRYAVVENPAQLRGAAERTVAAAQAIRSVYGGASDDWQVVMDDQAGGAALVAGVRRSLVEALLAASKAAGAKRVSMEPLFARALNDARAQVGAFTGWFGVVESGRVVLASLGADGVAGVRSQRVGQDPGTEVTALVQRARLLDGTAAQRTTLLLASEAPVAAAFPPESGLLLQQTTLRCVPDAMPVAA